MEAVAESDEELMSKYFDNGALTDGELSQGLAKGFAEGVISPVLCGAAGPNIGTDILLDSIVTICPSALVRKEVAVVEKNVTKMIPCNTSGPVAAFVFKTLSEEHLGEFNILRVFNGTVAIGQELANVTRSGYERVGNLYFLRGRERTDAQEVAAGDICALLKLKDTHTNDTLGDSKAVNFEFEKIKFREPLVNVAITAKNKGDEDKIGAGLTKLHEEDPVFTFQFRGDIRQSILSAMGDMHIEVLLENLKRRYKVEVERKQPKISYRETITKTVKYVEYTHKKQSGGAGQYAKVFIDMEPKERGSGYEFLDKIVGGVIDGSFRPSVDKGIQAKLKDGIVAGYPIVDVRVSLVDGKTHPVDSKDIAFQIAGREVFKKAFEMASPILLEPIVNIRVTIPDDFTGDVMGDLSSRRAKISGIEPGHKRATIVAKVPEQEVQTYSQTLRALTQGRGFYSKSFSHYEPVPGEVARKIIEASQKETAAAAA
jgi:elongation factor G